MCDLEFELFAYLIVSMISGLIVDVFFQCFFLRNKRIFSVICYTFFMIWQLYIFTNGALSVYLTLIISTILNAVIGIICFQGKVLPKIALSAVLSVIWTLAEFLIGTIFMLFGIDYRIPKILGAFISELIVLLLIICLRRFFNIDNIKMLPLSNYIMILLLPIGSLYIVYKLFEYSYILERDSVIKESLFCLLIMTVVNLIVFRLYIVLSEEMVKSKINAVYEQQVNLYSRALRDNETYIHEFRKVRHDLKQHYLSLTAMLGNGDYSMAKEYLKSLELDNQDVTSLVNTGNTIVDYIINAKYANMKINEIDCMVDIQIPMKMGFRSVDISVLLGNLLDNAIEANEFEIKYKYVKLYMRYEKCMLVLSIINSFDGIIRRNSAGRIITRKDDASIHGFGLTSIERIVDSYNGTITYEIEQNEFTAKVIMLDQKK